MARIASYSGANALPEPDRLQAPPQAASAAPTATAAEETCLVNLARPEDAAQLSQLQGLLTGAAESSCDFLDEIVNPWAAPELNEVAQGQVITRFLEGDSVTELQTRLNQLGYATEATGVMDSNTQALVQAFQADHELEATGQFGPLTLQALEQAEHKQAEHELAIEALKAMPSKDLHKLGRQDPQAFFKALLPAALESEREYGVPAAVTLAQGAMESDFARAPIGGYNIFGIKGSGPAGSVSVKTREVVKGKDVQIQAKFARYNNYYEAVKQHGKLFHNGNFDKPIQQYAQDQDLMAFIDGFSPTYATEPKYARTLKFVMAKYNLQELVAQSR